MRKLIEPIKNKTGAIRLIIFFSLLMIVLLVGFIATMVWAGVDYASDTITPIMEDLGVVENTNMSEVSEYTFGIADSFIESLNWIIALGYVFALVLVLVFVFVSGYSPHPAFIGLFFAFMILLIFFCVLMSNTYQDIYSGDDEIATRLHEQTITSFLILHSPFIMSMIAIIGGILMFTRQSNTEGGGGFGI